MAYKLYNETDIQDIAAAIRNKVGGDSTYKVREMGAAINGIPTGITPTGTKSITANGTYDVTNFASAAVNVQSGGIPLPATITAGDTPVIINPAAWSNSSGSMKNTNISVTIPKTGTYRFKWYVSAEGDGTITSRLYKNGAAVGSSHSFTCSDTNGYSNVETENSLSCNAGDVLTLWVKGVHSLGVYYGTAGMLMACIDWDVSKIWE